MLPPMTARGKRTAGGAKALPGRYYTDPAIFARELEQLFGARWLCVGRQSQLEAPGSTVLFELGRESVIVVRGEDDQIRAFHNVCRHRGARLCMVGGQYSRIRCPYHAWTYGLDGRLVGAPNMTEVAGFDRNDYPLLPVATAL